MVKNWLGIISALVSTAVISSLLTTAIIFSPSKLSNKIPPKQEETRETQWTSEDEIILKEQLARNISFLGEEAVQKLRTAFVVIVGVGGVGSHAAHMLLRSGVHSMRLIDFDQITVSSLNRHAVATRKDVGYSKVLVLKKRLLEILPHADIDAAVDLFSIEKAEKLLHINGKKPDFVLDCIDNLSTKIHLLTYCMENDIPLISAMGAGGKSDPSRIQIAELADTYDDPLCRQVRRYLKQRLGINAHDFHIPVVFSNERECIKLLPLDETVGTADELRVFDKFRVRIMPVLGPLPAMFGQAMAVYVMLCLAGAPPNLVGSKSRTDFYQRILKDLSNREKDTFKANTSETLKNITLEDIEFLVEGVFHNKSIKSMKRTHLVLTRWDRERPSTLDNLVLLTKPEATLHDQCASLQDAISQLDLSGEIVASIDKKHIIIRDYIATRRKNTIRKTARMRREEDRAIE